MIDDFIECNASGYIDENERDQLKNEAYHLIKVLNGYIASIKRQKVRDSSASK